MENSTQVTAAPNTITARNGQMVKVNTPGVPVISPVVQADASLGQVPQVTRAKTAAAARLAIGRKRQSRGAVARLGSVDSLGGSGSAMRFAFASGSVIRRPSRTSSGRWANRSPRLPSEPGRR